MAFGPATAALHGSPRQVLTSRTVVPGTGVAASPLPYSARPVRSANPAALCSPGRLAPGSPVAMGTVVPAARVAVSGPSPAGIGCSPPVSAESAAQSLAFVEEAKRLRVQGKTQDAATKIQQAIALNPTNAINYALYGDMLVVMNRMPEAIDAYKKVLALSPDWHGVRTTLAVVYKSANRHDDALAMARQALALQPKSAQALETVIQIQFFMCDWTDEAQLMKDLQTAVDIQISEGKLPTLTPWHCSTYPLDAEFVKRLSRAHAEDVLRSAKVLGCPPLVHPPQAPLRPGERLRIAYVSSEFNDHPVSHLMGSVFGLHDRTRYEVFCYSLRASDNSRWRKRVEETVEHFVEVGSWETVQIAKRISDDGIHIAVNLNGWTKNDRNQVFALRCAPLQIQLLGFPGTMCAPWIDYSVADMTVGPPEVRHCYGEPLALMPWSMIPTDHKQVHLDLLSTKPPPRSELGIPENAVVYACSNQLFKLTADLFAMWCRILKRVPGSVIWLQRSPAAAEPRLRQEFAKQGMDPSRLIFTDRCTKNEYMRRQALGDVFLDTPIYNAYTTGADSLWSGVPMVTLPLERMASRAAASECHATGFGSEMITRSPQEYEDRAVELGNDHAQRLSLRKRLSDARLTMPLYDTAMWTRDFERLCTALWDRHAAGLPPETLAIEPEPASLVHASAPSQIGVPPQASSVSIPTGFQDVKVPAQAWAQTQQCQVRGVMTPQVAQRMTSGYSAQVVKAAPTVRYQYATQSLPSSISATPGLVTCSLPQAVNVSVSAPVVVSTRVR